MKNKNKNSLLKRICKGIGKFLISVISFLVVLCIITLCWGAFQRTRGEKLSGVNFMPEDFKPEIRLIVFTDTHNENENVADAVDTSYRLFDGDETYKGVDAFYCLGDFTSIGTEPDYEAYAKTLSEHIRDETPCITIHGNHELKNKDEYKRLFEKYFGYEPDNVKEINGFSCIAFSGERSLTEWTFTPRSLKWLSTAVSQAEKTAGSKPVFVFQHPHPWGTVYGSSVWGDPQINVVLNGHKNVVDFSGHSHFPLNDPRSINQASYTSVGCGAMARFELDENCIVGQHPDGYEDAAQICIVEANSGGQVRIRGYDLISDTYVCDYFTDLSSDDAPYTYKNLKSHDASPEFSSDAQARAYKNENGEWVLSFDDAKVPDGFIVHEYKVTIKDENGKKIFGKNFINDYYIVDDENTADLRLGADTLQQGKNYTAVVRAESAYHKYSQPKEITFSAQ